MNKAFLVIHFHFVGLDGSKSPAMYPFVLIDAEYHVRITYINN